jgi:3-hydroxyacyl-[acyl-carrier-protein] dehydratase
MRYVLVDRITGLTPGESIDAVKNVTASDDLTSRYAPGLSLLPGSMVLEAMAQSVGLLLAATIDSAVQPVLAKVQPFTMYRDVRPGDQLTLHATLEALRDRGCRARAMASSGGHLVALATIYLALVPLPAASDAAALLRTGLADTFSEWFDAAGVRRPIGRS